MVQLVAVLLRMAQHGAKAIMTRQSFEEDGVPSVKESGNWTGLYSPSTPSTSHTSTAMEVDQSDNESEVSSKGIGGELGHSAERTASFLESAIVNRPAHIALDQVLVHVVTKVLLLEQPVSVRCRLLCMGRRLSAVSVLLPLPPRPLLLPSSGMEGLRLSQEQLARRLHALRCHGRPRRWGVRQYPSRPKQLLPWAGTETSPAGRRVRRRRRTTLPQHPGPLSMFPRLECRLRHRP